MPFFISDKEMEDEVSRRVAEACERVVEKLGANLHDVAIQKAFMCSMDFHFLKRSITDPELQSVLTRLETNFKDMRDAMRRESRRKLLSDNQNDPSL